MTTINDYLNSHTFQFWLQENFDDEEYQDLSDSETTDGVFPEAFIQWCYDAMAFDQEKTVYPVPTFIQEATFQEEEDIDHEFHFMEAPVCDDAEYNEICF